MLPGLFNRALITSDGADHFVTAEGYDALGLTRPITPVDSVCDVVKMVGMVFSLSWKSRRYWSPSAPSLAVIISVRQKAAVFGNSGGRR